MNGELTCAVVTFPPAGEEQRDLPAKSSIQAAIDFGRGPFSRIFELPIIALDETGGEARNHNAGVARALDNQADWIFFLHAGDTLNPDAFVLAAPSLRLFDAVWGAASLFDGDEQIKRVVKISRLACQSFEGFFHLALRWWIGKSHFIKTDVAAAHPCESDEEPWYFRYLLGLWEQRRCLKTAQPFTAHRHALAGLDDSDRQLILDYLDDHPVFLDVRSGEHQAKLPFTGRNPVIEREQTRGMFFEQEELDYLATQIPAGGTIVDVGSNTGNHTVYFSLFMNPERVIPIEPAPRSIAALKGTVAVNGLTNVDLSNLGVGAGDKRGLYTLQLSESGGLGATRLRASVAGEIQVFPLDEIIDEPVDFLKIDVETMELNVLEGAKGLISKYRPSLFIEIIDQNIEEFLQWVDGHDYRIEKIFPDKTHTNYFLIPMEGILENRTRGADD